MNIKMNTWSINISELHIQYSNWDNWIMANSSDTTKPLLAD